MSIATNTFFNINIATILLGNAKRVATLLSIGRRALRQTWSHPRSFLWWLNADGTCLYIPLSTKTRSAKTPVRRCHCLLHGVETLIKCCHRILQKNNKGILYPLGDTSRDTYSTTRILYPRTWFTSESCAGVQYSCSGISIPWRIP